MSIIVPKDSEQSTDKLLLEVYEQISAYNDGKLLFKKLFDYFEGRFVEVVDVMVARRAVLSDEEKQYFCDYSQYLCDVVFDKYVALRDSSALGEGHLMELEDVRQRIAPVLVKINEGKKMVCCRGIDDIVEDVGKVVYWGGISYKANTKIVDGIKLPEAVKLAQWDENEYNSNKDVVKLMNIIKGHYDSSTKKFNNDHNGEDMKTIYTELFKHVKHSGMGDKIKFNLNDTTQQAPPDKPTAIAKPTAKPATPAKAKPATATAKPDKPTATTAAKPAPATPDELWNKIGELTKKILINDKLYSIYKAHFDDDINTVIHTVASKKQYIKSVFDEVYYNVYVDKVKPIATRLNTLCETDLKLTDLKPFKNYVSIILSTEISKAFTDYNLITILDKEFDDVNTRISDISLLPDYIVGMEDIVEYMNNIHPIDTLPYDWIYKIDEINEECKNFILGNPVVDMTEFDKLIKTKISSRLGGLVYDLKDFPILVCQITNLKIGFQTRRAIDISKITNDYLNENISNYLEYDLIQQFSYYFTQESINEMNNSKKNNIKRLSMIFKTFNHEQNIWYLMGIINNSSKIHDFVIDITKCPENKFMTLNDIYQKLVSNVSIKQFRTVAELMKKIKTIIDNYGLIYRFDTTTPSSDVEAELSNVIKTNGANSGADYKQCLKIFLNDVFKYLPLFDDYVPLNDWPIKTIVDDSWIMNKYQTDYNKICDSIIDLKIRMGNMLYLKNFSSNKLIGNWFKSSIESNKKYDNIIEKYKELKTVKDTEIDEMFDLFMFDAIRCYDFLLPKAAKKDTITNAFGIIKQYIENCFNILSGPNSIIVDQIIKDSSNNQAVILQCRLIDKKYKIFKQDSYTKILLYVKLIKQLSTNINIFVAMFNRIELFETIFDLLPTKKGLDMSKKIEYVFENPKIVLNILYDPKIIDEYGKIIVLQESTRNILFQQTMETHFRYNPPNAASNTDPNTDPSPITADAAPAPNTDPNATPPGVNILLPNNSDGSDTSEEEDQEVGTAPEEDQEVGTAPEASQPGIYIKDISENDVLYYHTNTEFDSRLVYSLDVQDITRNNDRNSIELMQIASSFNPVLMNNRLRRKREFAKLMCNYICDINLAGFGHIGSAVPNIDAILINDTDIPLSNKNEFWHYYQNSIKAIYKIFTNIIIVLGSNINKYNDTDKTFAEITNDYDSYEQHLRFVMRNILKNYIDHFYNIIDTIKNLLNSKYEYGSKADTLSMEKLKIIFDCVFIENDKMYNPGKDSSNNDYRKNISKCVINVESDTNEKIKQNVLNGYEKALFIWNIYYLRKYLIYYGKTSTNIGKPLLDEIAQKFSKYDNGDVYNVSDGDSFDIPTILKDMVKYLPNIYGQYLIEKYFVDGNGIIDVNVNENNKNIGDFLSDDTKKHIDNQEFLIFKTIGLNNDTNSKAIIGINLDDITINGNMYTASHLVLENKKLNPPFRENVIFVKYVPDTADRKQCYMIHPTGFPVWTPDGNYSNTYKRPPGTYDDPLLFVIKEIGQCIEFVMYQRINIDQDILNNKFMSKYLCQPWTQHDVIQEPVADAKDTRLFEMYSAMADSYYVDNYMYKNCIQTTLCDLGKKIISKEAISNEILYGDIVKKYEARIFKYLEYLDPNKKSIDGMDRTQNTTEKMEALINWQTNNLDINNTLFDQITKQINKYNISYVLACAMGALDSLVRENINRMFDSKKIGLINPKLICFANAAIMFLWNLPPIRNFVLFNYKNTNDYIQQLKDTIYLTYRLVKTNKQQYNKLLDSFVDSMGSMYKIFYQLANTTSQTIDITEVLDNTDEKRTNFCKFVVSSESTYKYGNTADSIAVLNHVLDIIDYFLLTQDDDNTTISPIIMTIQRTTYTTILPNFDYSDIYHHTTLADGTQVKFTTSISKQPCLVFDMVNSTIQQLINNEQILSEFDASYKWYAKDINQYYDSQGSNSKCFKKDTYIISPDLKYIIITIKANLTNAVRSTVSIVPNRYIIIDDTYFLLSSCVCYPTGHYFYIKFDDNTDPLYVIDDDLIIDQDFNDDIHITNINTQGTIFLYKRYDGNFDDIKDNLDSKPPYSPNIPKKNKPDSTINSTPQIDSNNIIAIQHTTTPNDTQDKQNIINLRHKIQMLLDIQPNYDVSDINGGQDACTMLCDVLKEMADFMDIITCDEKTTYADKITDTHTNASYNEIYKHYSAIYDELYKIYQQQDFYTNFYYNCFRIEYINHYINYLNDLYKQIKTQFDTIYKSLNVYKNKSGTNGDIFLKTYYNSQNFDPDHNIQSIQSIKAFGTRPEKYKKSLDFKFEYKRLYDYLQNNNIFINNKKNIKDLHNYYVDRFIITIKAIITVYTAAIYVEFYTKLDTPDLKIPDMKQILNDCNTLCNGFDETNRKYNDGTNNSTIIMYWENGQFPTFTTLIGRAEAYYKDAGIKFNEYAANTKTNKLSTYQQNIAVCNTMVLSMDNIKSFIQAIDSAPNYDQFKQAVSDVDTKISDLASKTDPHEIVFLNESITTSFDKYIGATQMAALSTAIIQIIDAATDQLVGTKNADLAALAKNIENNTTQFSTNLKAVLNKLIVRANKTTIDEAFAEYNIINGIDLTTHNRNILEANRLEHVLKKLNNAKPATPITSRPIAEQAIYDTALQAIDNEINSINTRIDYDTKYDDDTYADGLISTLQQANTALFLAVQAAASQASAQQIVDAQAAQQAAQEQQAQQTYIDSIGAITTKLDDIKIADLKKIAKDCQATIRKELEKLPAIIAATPNITNVIDTPTLSTNLATMQTNIDSFGQIRTDIDTEYSKINTAAFDQAVADVQAQNAAFAKITNEDTKYKITNYAEADIKIQTIGKLLNKTISQAMTQNIVDDIDFVFDPLKTKTNGAADNLSIFEYIEYAKLYYEKCNDVSKQLSDEYNKINSARVSSIADIDQKIDAHTIILQDQSDKIINLISEFNSKYQEYEINKQIIERYLNELVSDKYLTHNNMTAAAQFYLANFDKTNADILEVSALRIHNKINRYKVLINENKSECKKIYDDISVSMTNFRVNKDIEKVKASNTKANEYMTKYTTHNNTQNVAYNAIRDKVDDPTLATYYETVMLQTLHIDSQTTYNAIIAITRSIKDITIDLTAQYSALKNSTDFDDTKYTEDNANVKAVPDNIKYPYLLGYYNAKIKQFITDKDTLTENHISIINIDIDKINVILASYGNGTILGNLIIKSAKTLMLAMAKRFAIEYLNSQKTEFVKYSINTDIIDEAITNTTSITNPTITFALPNNISEVDAVLNIFYKSAIGVFVASAKAANTKHQSTIKKIANTNIELNNVQNLPTAPTTFDRTAYTKILGEYDIYYDDMARQSTTFLTMCQKEAAVLNKKMTFLINPANINTTPIVDIGATDIFGTAITILNAENLPVVSITDAMYSEYYEIQEAKKFIKILDKQILTFKVREEHINNLYRSVDKTLDDNQQQKLTTKLINDIINLITNEYRSYQTLADELTTKYIKTEWTVPIATVITESIDKLKEIKTAYEKIASAATTLIAAPQNVSKYCAYLYRKSYIDAYDKYDTTYKEYNNSISSTITLINNSSPKDFSVLLGGITSINIVSNVNLTTITNQIETACDTYVSMYDHLYTQQKNCIAHNFAWIDKAIKLIDSNKLDDISTKLDTFALNDKIKHVLNVPGTDPNMKKIIDKFAATFDTTPIKTNIALSKRLYDFLKDVKKVIDDPAKYRSVLSNAIPIYVTLATNNQAKAETEADALLKNTIITDDTIGIPDSAIYPPSTKKHIDDYNFIITTQINQTTVLLSLCGDQLAIKNICDKIQKHQKDAIDAFDTLNQDMVALISAFVGFCKQFVNRATKLDWITSAASLNYSGWLNINYIEKKYIDAIDVSTYQHATSCDSTINFLLGHMNIVLANVAWSYAHFKKDLIVSNQASLKNEIDLMGKIGKGLVGAITNDISTTDIDRVITDLLTVVDDRSIVCAYRVFDNINQIYINAMATRTASDVIIQAKLYTEQNKTIDTIIDRINTTGAVNDAVNDLINKIDTYINPKIPAVYTAPNSIKTNSLTAWGEASNRYNNLINKTKAVVGGISKKLQGIIKQADINTINNIIKQKIAGRDTVDLAEIADAFRTKLNSLNSLNTLDIELLQECVNTIQEIANTVQDAAQNSKPASSTQKAIDANNDKIKRIQGRADDIQTYTNEIQALILYKPILAQTKQIALDSTYENNIKSLIAGWARVPQTPQSTTVAPTPPTPGTTPATKPTTPGPTGSTITGSTTSTNPLPSPIKVPIALTASMNHFSKIAAPTNGTSRAKAVLLATLTELAKGTTPTNNATPENSAVLFTACDGIDPASQQDCANLTQTIANFYSSEQAHADQYIGTNLQSAKITAALTATPPASNLQDAIANLLPDEAYVENKKYESASIYQRTLKYISDIVYITAYARFHKKCGNGTGVQGLTEKYFDIMADGTDGYYQRVANIHTKIMPEMDKFLVSNPTPISTVLDADTAHKIIYNNSLLIETLWKDANELLDAIINVSKIQDEINSAKYYFDESKQLESDVDTTISSHTITIAPPLKPEFDKEIAKTKYYYSIIAQSRTFDTSQKRAANTKTAFDMASKYYTKVIGAIHTVVAIHASKQSYKEEQEFRRILEEQELIQKQKEEYEYWQKEKERQRLERERLKNEHRNKIIVEKETYEIDNVNINSYESIINYIREYGVEQTSENISQQLIYKNVPLLQPSMVGKSLYAEFLLNSQNEILHHKRDGISIDDMWHKKEFVHDIVHPILEENGFITYDLLYKGFAEKSGLTELIDMETIDDTIKDTTSIVDMTGETFGAGIFLAQKKSTINKYHVVPPININKSLFAKFMNDSRFSFRSVDDDFSEFDTILVDAATEPRWLEIIDKKYHSKIVRI
jgi:hypothetical protein